MKKIVLMILLALVSAQCTVLQNTIKSRHNGKYIEYGGKIKIQRTDTIIVFTAVRHYMYTDTAGHYIPVFVHQYTDTAGHYIPDFVTHDVFINKEPVFYEKYRNVYCKMQITFYINNLSEISEITVDNKGECNIESTSEDNKVMISIYAKDGEFLGNVLYDTTDGTYGEIGPDKAGGGTINAATNISAYKIPDAYSLAVWGREAPQRYDQCVEVLIGSVTIRVFKEPDTTISFYPSELSCKDKKQQVVAYSSDGEGIDLGCHKKCKATELAYMPKNDSCIIPPKGMHWYQNDSNDVYGCEQIIHDIGIPPDKVGAIYPPAGSVILYGNDLACYDKPQE